MKIILQLQKVQTELKAPKGQYNSFGKYKYRSLEDILEAVKPLLAKEKMTLTIADTIENIGDRYYVKATATLTNEDGETYINTAYARESDTKSGMDTSQITGASSSYARKYCVNGLFCIDDTKDSDTSELREEQTNRTELERKQLLKKAESLGANLPKIAEHCKCTIDTIPIETLKTLIKSKEQAKGE